jgi:hypothetical protein
MPITPEEARLANLKLIEGDLQRIYERIDKELGEKYYGDNIVVVDITGSASTRIIEQVLKVYCSSGWNVTHRPLNHQQKPIDSFTFKKKTVETPPEEQRDSHDPPWRFDWRR